VAYSVLALGDTNYDQFCETGRNIDKKLNAWGAKRGMELVCADEATGLEGSVEPWLDDVLGRLEKACLEEDVVEEEKKDEEEKLSGEMKEKLSVSNDKAATKKEETSEKTATTLPTKNVTPAKPATFPPTTTTSKTTTTSPPTKSPTPLYILYGSATGNAEHIAKDLAATYEGYLQNPSFLGYFPSVVCCDLNAYKKKCLDAWSSPPCEENESVKHGVIIVCSTTGNADAPENSDRFIRWMKRKTTDASQPFKHCAYAVMGLGDTNYDVFCAMGHLIDKRLGDLGGTRALKGVMADEATGLEETVEPWVGSVIGKLASVCKGEGQESVAKVEVEQSTDVEKTVAASTPAVTAPDIATAATAAVPKKLKEPSPSSVEEKEMDAEETVIPTASTTSSSVGVSTVRALLSLSSNTESLPTIPNSSLPSMVSSLSSCQLINEETMKRPRGESIADNMTISSTSSGFLYTAAKPYESSILDARYLTMTDVKCATKITAAASSLGEMDDEQLMGAMKMYEEHFPLADISSAIISEQQRIQYDKNGKRVIELTLALPDDFTLEYQPGDSVGLIVPNSPAPTQFILSMLQKSHGIVPTQKISVDAAHPITVEEAVRTTVDLCCTMKKRWLFVLSMYATDPEEERALRLLSSKETTASVDLFQTYIEDQHRTVVDILQEFPSCQSITLEDLLGCLPAIPPRYYSVCSSPLHDRQSSGNGNDGHYHLKVAFSVVDYLTPALPEDGKTHRRRMGGVATRRLECVGSPFLSNQASSESDSKNLPTTTAVQIFPKPTHDFRLPSNMSTPLILIGPGTGIAPFIGFLSHRQAQLASLDSTQAAEMTSEGTWRGGYELEQNELALSKGDVKGLNLAVDYMSKHQQVGDIDLFFGCRYSDGYDYLYQKELEEFKKDGILTNLYTAFSREEGSKEKMYVQTLMQKNVAQCGKRLLEMIIEKEASVYICGDGNAMGKDVQEAIVSLLAGYFCDKGVCNDMEEGRVRGAAHVDQMKTSGRFVLDIWS